MQFIIQLGNPVTPCGPYNDAHKYLQLKIL